MVSVIITYECAISYWCFEFLGTKLLAEVFSMREFYAHLISHINFYFELVVYCLVVVLLGHSSQNFIFIFFYMNTCINVYVCVSVLVINILWKHTSGALCAGLWCNVFVKLKRVLSHHRTGTDISHVLLQNWSNIQYVSYCMSFIYLPIHEQKQLLRWNNFI